MKKYILTLLMAAVTLNISAQQKKVILPGKGHIDVEKLNEKIDLTQDVSQLSISETRVLRNAFAARQGYCLMSADLRSIYNATSWYDSLMNERWWKENEEEYTGNAPQHKAKPIGYTRGELRFIKQLEAHEIELRKQNFKVAEGEKVNIDNLINPFQMETIPQQLKKTLAKNGFAIVPTDYNQLFQVYEYNDYHDFPNFVTTDLFLQAFHTYFDCILRDLEIEKFDSLLTLLCRDSHTQLTQTIATQKKNKKTVAAIMGVPPFVLGVGEYNKAEWNAFIQGTIMTLAKSLAAEMTKKLIISPSWYLTFNVWSLLDFDLKTVSDVLLSGADRGYVSGDEWRDRMHMSPAGLTEYKILENYIPYDMSGNQKKLAQNED